MKNSFTQPPELNPGSGMKRALEHWTKQEAKDADEILKLAAKIDRGTSRGRITLAALRLKVQLTQGIWDYVKIKSETEKTEREMDEVYAVIKKNEQFESDFGNKDFLHVASGVEEEK